MNLKEEIHYFSVEKELAQKIYEIARRQGISTHITTFANSSIRLPLPSVLANRDKQNLTLTQSTYVKIKIVHQRQNRLTLGSNSYSVSNEYQGRRLAAAEVVEL